MGYTEERSVVYGVSLLEGIAVTGGARKRDDGLEMGPRVLGSTSPKNFVASTPLRRLGGPVELDSTP